MPGIGSGWVHRAPRLVADQPAGEATGMLRFMEASEALEAHDVEAARAAARDLLRLAEALGSPSLAALGSLTEGVVALQEGDLANGFASLDEAMLPVLADQVPAELAGNIFCVIIETCSQLGDVARFREWLETTERWCSGFSHAVMFLGICRAHRVELLTLDGAWDEAEREAERVRRELADHNVSVVAECDYLLGDLHRIRGRADAAATASEELAGIAERYPTLAFTTWAETARGSVLLNRGNAEEALVPIRAALRAFQAMPDRRGGGRDQPPGRRPVGDQREDATAPPGQRLRQARGRVPDSGERVAARARPGASRLTCTIRTTIGSDLHRLVDAPGPRRFLASVPPGTRSGRSGRRAVMTTLSESNALDPGRVEEFADRMLGSSTTPVSVC